MKKQFESFKATELYCARCKVSRPVRERLLLVLPRGEINAYRCEFCGEPVGTREISSTEGNIVIAKR